MNAPSFSTEAKPSSPDCARATESALAMAFDHSRDMMLLARVEPGVLLRVVAVNRTYAEALNRAGVAVTADELAGLTFDETADRLGLDAESRRAVRTIFEAAIRGGKAVEYDEITPVAGGVFYGRTTLTPIPDAAGGCGHVLYSSRDVSAQRQAEQALRTTRETTANLLGNLSGMAYRCRNDEHWTMEFVSEGVHELAGYAPEAVIGNRDISWEMIVHPEDRARIRDEFNRDARPGLRKEGTYRIVTADGREKWVIERALALGGADGGISHYEGIVTDITELKRAELAVAEKEHALSAILDHSFQFIGLMDADGRMLRSNRTALESVGATEPEVVGKFFWDTPWWAGMPEEQAKLRDAVARVGRGEFVRFQTRHPGADGRVLHVDFSLKPVFGADGRVALMIPEGRDITEIRQAQEALRFSEEKFHRAFHGSPNIICISRLADGLMMEVNETFGREYGVPPEQARGRTSMELGIWADEAERAEFVARLSRDGRVRDLFRERTMAGGRRRALLVSVEPILIDGEPCLLTTSVDVTAQTEAERALRESEEKFAKAFRGSPYSLTISDRDTGRYLDINAGFERVSGYRRDEVIGRTSMELGIWVDLDDRAEIVRRLREHGAVRGLEVRFRAKRGEIVTALCNIEQIELAGRPCLLSAIEDVSERRRMEEEKTRLEAQLRQNQKLEALGTLAGGIAHDFNNILTAIIVNQELALLDLGRPAELRGRLEAIARASSRAKNLVRQILAFSRQQPVARHRQALAPLVTEALSFVRASLPSTIVIDLAIAPDAPMVRADENQVHQVLMNLCTNAAQAMRETGGRLTVRLEPTTLDEAACRERPGLAPGRHARIVVADTGHGMDEAVLARVFEPFFTTKGPGEGTGLGLSLVHGIMRDHEGGVWVRSRPGEGSEFELFFPEDRLPDERDATDEAAVPAGAGQSILLVDDETAVAEAMASILRKLGYRVEKFHEPQAALGRFLLNPDAFDLLLTDCTMPAMTGPELIARAREARPELPAIIMTGLRSAIPPGSPAAASPVLDKPPGIAALSRAVHKALSSPRPA